MRRLGQFFTVTLALFAGQSAFAFALLGPFAPWMTTPLAYQLPTAIGGPMLIGQGYRWNVPLITYAFDQSFLDYFGTNGVAAVESAIQVLNDFPPASHVDLSTYPLKSSRVNFVAQSGNLVDLKSQALVMLVEQMGLAQPSASVNTLRNFSYNPTNLDFTYSLENRNYDPQALYASIIVNTDIFAPQVAFHNGNNVIFYDEGASNGFIDLNSDLGFFLPVGDAIATSLTDAESANSSVADYESGSAIYGDGLSTGTYFSSLTADDAGGLAYLLSTNNLALESLLPDVHGLGTNFVRTALRPGVNKITFQRVNFDSIISSIFPPFTNIYIDAYITNGVIQYQTVERTLTQPDILFTAKYIGNNNVSRTGTSNWINNGAPLQDGPGVIQPPITINFNKLGPSLIYNDPNYSPANATTFLPLWASFDGTTNAPVVYPINSSLTNTSEFHFLLFGPSSFLQPVASFTWNSPVTSNGLFNLQTSTNLSDWLTIATITNQGGTFTYQDFIYTNTPQRYFRTVPQ